MQPAPVFFNNYEHNKDMETIAKKQTIQEKRAYLKELSAGLGVLKKNGVVDSVNEALEQLYAEQGHTTLKTYNDWKKEGFQVKKGESALLLWGRPKSKRPEEQEQKPTNKNDEHSNSSFFPLAFLFSNLQVYEIGKGEA